MNNDERNTPEIEELVDAWQTYLKTIDWQTLIVGAEPKLGGCGKVYELDNPIDHPNESFAIADMRGWSFRNRTSISMAKRGDEAARPAAAHRTVHCRYDRP